MKLKPSCKINMPKVVWPSLGQCSATCKVVIFSNYNHVTELPATACMYVYQCYLDLHKVWMGTSNSDHSRKYKPVLCKNMKCVYYVIFLLTKHFSEFHSASEVCYMHYVPYTKVIQWLSCS